jgi:hypothetical protein
LGLEESSFDAGEDGGGETAREESEKLREQ